MVEERGYFRHDGFRLFAAVHAPDRCRSPVGVVLNHPFGEERQFTDHVLVRLARRLAAAGFAAIRFDRRGYGESDGYLRDATVETQIAETLGATSFLRRRLDVGRVVFLGLRWGATVSALAAEREETVSGLILWSPIVSGATYADEIIRRRVFAQLANREGRVTTAGLRAALRAGQLMEFEGDYVTPRLFDDISAVELPPHTTRFRRPLFVGTVRPPGGTGSPFESVVDSYRERGAAADLVSTDDPEYWDDRSMFGGFIPERLLDATLEWLRAHRASAA